MRRTNELKKVGIVAALATLALVLGLAGFGRTTEVEAKPTDILALNPVIVNALSDATCAPACDLAVPADLLDVADSDGDGDGNVEPSDFEGLDLDADQLMEISGALWILVFVDDDDAVTVDPKANLDFVEDIAGNNDGDLQCDAAGTDITEEDCNEDGVADDGVVVGTLVNDTADPGDVEEIEAEQEGIYLELDVNVVGEPDEIEVATFPDPADVQAGFTGGDCEDLDLGDFMDETGAVEVAGFAAQVTDGAGTALTGVLVEWDSDDVDVAETWTDPASDTVTVDSDLGPWAFNFGCGVDPGATEICATIDSGAGDIETECAAINVFGEPADMALTAAPGEIVCDGVNSADVTATVTDADGNPVVDGTAVRFDVVALGTAFPITAETAGGMASSTITPLSDIGAGVTVLVSAGDAEASIRVDCSEPPPPPPPPPPATPEPGIVPPPTGTGGYLGADASGLSWLALAGLAIGGLTLSLGGIALRRYAR
jgi:hypothetical protein